MASKVSALESLRVLTLPDVCVALWIELEIEPALLLENGGKPRIVAPVRFHDHRIVWLLLAQEFIDTRRLLDYSATSWLRLGFRLVTTFVSVLEATAGRRIYAELLATYVGRDPGAQIMAGAVKRGEVHHLKAAMLLADLRGFSRLTDELPEQQIVELLNAFFDLVVPGVVAGGGDVLKYIGDAVIAIFPVAGDDPAPACELALAAAQTALAALQSAPPEIQQHISIDIALHYGVAAYGNIGSGNRLDFSVVGRDVNILSRLELLCKDVGRPLLMTDALAVEVAEPVIEIGHFELRGFRRHQAVYALCQEGEQPCRPKASLARA